MIIFITVRKFSQESEREAFAELMKYFVTEIRTYAKVVFCYSLFVTAPQIFNYSSNLLDTMFSWDVGRKSLEFNVAVLLDLYLSLLYLRT